MPDDQRVEERVDEVDVPGLKGYTGADAQRLFAQYESADFDEIHSQWLCYLPPSGARVADIGAGSGRDAAALSERGFAVTAVEPSLDMITQAKLRHGSSTIEWIQDYLPSLGKLRQERRTFDLLLLSAVWMHLDKREQSYATDTLVTLMNSKAVAVITARHPIDPSRHMFNVDIAETADAARDCGLSILLAKDYSDPAVRWGREGVSWSLLVLANIQSDGPDQSPQDAARPLLRP